MTVLRRFFEVFARIDPGLWYLLDLRRRSAVSWIPVALLLAVSTFGAVECLLAGNTGGVAVLSTMSVVFLAVKLQAVARG
jgi:hypothetical protein